MIHRADGAPFVYSQRRLGLPGLCRLRGLLGMGMMRMGMMGMIWMMGMMGMLKLHYYNI